jgi:hypothetical protein
VLGVAGESQAGQGAVGGGGEQLQGVPAAPPGVPDALLGVQHQVLDAGAGQVPGRDQPGLAAANDQDVDALDH